MATWYFPGIVKSVNRNLSQLNKFELEMNIFTL